MKTISLIQCVFAFVSISLPVLVVSADRVEPLPYRNILTKIHQQYAHFIVFFRICGTMVCVHRVAEVLERTRRNQPRLTQPGFSGSTAKPGSMYGDTH